MRYVCILLLLTSMAQPQEPEPAGRMPVQSDRTQLTLAVAGMTLRAVDLGQTMYHLNQTTWYAGKAYHGRETWLPTQNKAAISVAVLGSGVLTTYGQYRLYRSGHKRLAILTQVISIGVSSAAIYRSFHSTYPVPSAK